MTTDTKSNNKPQVIETIFNRLTSALIFDNFLNFRLQSALLGFWKSVGRNDKGLSLEWTPTTNNRHVGHVP